MTACERSFAQSHGLLSSAVLPLTVCVTSQVLLVGLFSGLAPERRSEWLVTLALWALLVAPTCTLLLGAWRIRVRDTRAFGIALVAAGCLMRVPYFASGPLFEDDHLRYLLDGAVLASGQDPYRHAPADLLANPQLVAPGLVETGHGIIARINFPDLRSIYPGTAQLLFAISHLIAPWGLNGLRSVAFLSEALTALLLWRLAVAQGYSPWRVAVVWCNPLLAFTLTGQAHIDAVIMPLLLGAAVATHRQRGGAAGLAVGLAVGVKLWPVLVAPVVARALWGNTRAVTAFVFAAALSSAVLCIPLVMSSLTPNSGLTAYAAGWAINNAPFAWASFLAVSLGGSEAAGLLRVAIGLSMCALALALAYRPIESLHSLFIRLCLVAAAAFYSSPAQFPWYAAWFLPLAALCGCWPLVAASVLLPTYYVFFPLADAGARDAFIYGVSIVHLVPVLALSWIAHRRGRPA